MHDVASVHIQRCVRGRPVHATAQRPIFELPQLSASLLRPCTSVRRAQPRHSGWRAAAVLQLLLSLLCRRVVYIFTLFL